MLSEKVRIFDKKRWPKSEWAKSEWAKSEWPKSEFPQNTASSMEVFSFFCFWKLRLTQNTRTSYWTTFGHIHFTARITAGTTLGCRILRISCPTTWRTGTSPWCWTSWRPSSLAGWSGSCTGRSSTVWRKLLPLKKGVLGRHRVRGPGPRSGPGSGSGSGQGWWGIGWWGTR